MKPLKQIKETLKDRMNQIERPAFCGKNKTKSTNRHKTKRRK